MTTLPGTAVISGCGTYRYGLTRILDATTPRRLAFIMLNPSTADDRTDDPTIRRCLGYARRWGFSQLEVGNLFAFRSTSPKALRGAADPVGPQNDRALVEIADRAEIVICGWGTDGALLKRGRAVVRWLTLGGLGPKLHHLGLTKYRQPKHPLYLRGDLEPIPLAFGDSL